MVKRILWADDNQTFRESMIASLEMHCSREGIDVTFDVASSGEELVGKVRSNQYDLVFTDNQMPPGIHGLLAICQIREQDTRTPVYMVSSSEVGKQAIEVGATGYIDKTDQPQLFKAGIQDAVRKHLR